MDEMMLKTFLGGLVRHALTTAGGALVTDGVLQSSDVNGFVGAGMVLAGVGWSLYQKYGHTLIAAQLAKITKKGS